jgi:hypothetical protein
MFCRCFALAQHASVRFDNVEEVEEGIRRVRIVPGERLERVLAVQEDDGVTTASEEMLGGGGAAGSG